MKLDYTKHFVRDFHNLPASIQSRVEKKMEFLAGNPHHPSLNLKKVQGFENIWRIKITAAYRLTLQIEETVCILRRVGPHDVLRKP